jgi:hypothetical protein
MKERKKKEKGKLSGFSWRVAISVIVSKILVMISDWPTHIRSLSLA